MCWTLQPQSLCIHCGAEVNFLKLLDPCEFVILKSANFGACGQDNWRVVLGPEDATCDDCLVPEDPQINYRFNVQRTPAPVSSPIGTPNLAIARGGPRARVPFIHGSSLRGHRQPHGSRHISGDDLAQARFGRSVPPSGPVSAGRRAIAAVMASPFDVRNPTPTNQRPASGTHGGQQTRGGMHVRGSQGRGGVRPPTPAPRAVRPPVPVVEDEEEDFNEPCQPHSSSSPRSSGGGARLYSSSSKYTSSLNSSDPSSLPRLTLPGADSPFTFGHTPGRPVPNPSPATASFLAASLNPAGGGGGGGIQQLPPLPTLEDDWVPAEWGQAFPMPAELAHELDYTNADCVFHRHRVYFVASHADLVGPSVIVVKPCGLKAHIVSFEVYKVTSAEVNRREVEVRGTEEHEARLAYEGARQNQLADERRRKWRGACIFHPCRVAGCPNWHEQGQHQPLTPGNMGALLRASRGRRSRDKKKMKKQAESKQKAKELAFASSDDVFGYDGDGEEEEEEERGRSSSARRSPPRSSLRPTAQDETEDTAFRTPSTLRLSGGAHTKRAPVHLVEKEGEVERRPTRNPATISSGSPEPPRFPRYAHLQQASGGSTSTSSSAKASQAAAAAAAATDKPPEAGRKDGHDDRAAMRLLDNGPDLGELRDLQIRELEGEETF